jgi:hypothetical protein
MRQELHKRVAGERASNAQSALLAAQETLMKRLSFWLTILAGATAAYLMYRRGESPLNIAKNTVSNPLGTFTSEIQKAL